MTTAMIYYILIILVFLCGSAYFSAAEMALSASNRMRLENAAEEGSRTARLACMLLDRSEDTLSAILIGNNLCNIGSDSLATLVCVTLFGEKFTPVSTVIMTLIVIFFCESAPKIVAKKNANRFAMAFAGFLRFLMIVLMPVIWLVRVLIRVLTAPFKGEKRSNDEAEAAAELQSIIETVEDEGVIDEDRSEMLLSALDFAEIPVMDVMTARVDVMALDIDDDPAEFFAAAYNMPVSRLPVYEDSIDNVIGVLYLNRLLRAVLDEGENVDIRALLLPVCYFYKTVKLPEALSTFRKQQQHMAIVTDEYGGTLGIVTMEDVLEQLVGDIWDETDEVERDVVERDGGWELDGDLPTTTLPEILNLSDSALDDSDSATVGGWTMEKFGRFPRDGESFLWKDWRVTVLAMAEDGRRVDKLWIEPIKKKEEE